MIRPVSREELIATIRAGRPPEDLQLDDISTTALAEILRTEMAVFLEVFAGSSVTLADEQLVAEINWAIMNGYGFGWRIMSLRGWKRENMTTGSTDEINQRWAGLLISEYANMKGSAFLGDEEGTITDLFKVSSKSRLDSCAFQSDEDRKSAAVYFGNAAVRGTLFALFEASIRLPERPSTELPSMPTKKKSRTQESSRPARKQAEVMPWEEFFVQKIEQGLGSRVLSDDERDLLLTPVHEIGATGTSPRDAEKLQAKAMEALTMAYSEDMRDRNRQAVIVWRDNNNALYEHSQLVISGIVQNWYLEVGRRARAGPRKGGD